MRNEVLHLMAGECYFSRNLRKLRLLRQPRLSQEHLAETLGVSRATYAKYEQGRRMPPAWFVFCTAKYFGVAIEELFREDITYEQSNRKDERIRNESIAYRYAKKDRE